MTRKSIVDKRGNTPNMSEANQKGAILDGRYRLVEQLASTHFSTIYKGVQLSTQQAVAIKLLNTSQISREARGEFEARFRREMAIYADVRHPNLVRLLDRGSTDEALYLVLEFIQGQSLGRVLHDERQIKPFEAKHLMSQCLDALSAGHKEGIVHRDFKPGNVMVTSTGTNRNAVVLDFGLAKFQHEDPLGKTLSRPITMPGMTPGTPQYMAPEQLDGEVTPQSDIYAWGLVYLECLTGVRASGSQNNLKTLVDRLKKPLEIPEWLDREPISQILRKATAKSLDDRYQTALDVLSDLRSCPMGELHADRAVIEIEDDEPDSEEAFDSFAWDLSEPDINPSAPLTLPSLLLSEMDNARTAVQLDETVSETLMRELNNLYDDYRRVCEALGFSKGVTREEFVTRASNKAQALRREVGCRAIKYRIVVEDEDVRLQPVILN
ncbi:MAG: hypothetical protein AUK47_19555 [Deltaproteobacteria bacterium CG2_30_63_29]|nr:MAG: hypothetical protein AUK47_19555 [Deltaproteobacteria bacterium CG2_30_63_29]PJB48552.1 MAG: hypothetical protein CO108_02150 [Deltaproteobacteria bacterium CG_4_9_14_3_um_filter_63_12]